MCVCVYKWKIKSIYVIGYRNGSNNNYNIDVWPEGVRKGKIQHLGTNTVARTVKETHNFIVKNIVLVHSWCLVLGNFYLCLLT